MNPAIHINKRLLALLTGSGLLCSPAMAANTAFAPGDLVLFLQERTGSNTLYVNLGNAATLYTRGQTGVNGPSVFNITNVGAQLESAFGPTWASNTEVYAGLAAVWGTSPTNSTLQDGDPHRTLYVSQPRAIVGVNGTAASATVALNTDTGMTNGASGITSMQLPFENLYEGAVAISPKSESTIDDQNPFVTVGLTTIQDTAFNVFAGGVQQQGGTGIFGDFEWVEDVEFALDLYRVQARGNIAGQTGFGEAARQGTFEGTFVLDTSGNVSFLTAQIPEASTTMLALISGVAALAHRRRKPMSQE
jgi:hypothetical protein